MRAGIWASILKRLTKHYINKAWGCRNCYHQYFEKKDVNKVKASNCEHTTRTNLTQCRIWPISYLVPIFWFMPIVLYWKQILKTKSWKQKVENKKTHGKRSWKCEHIDKPCSLVEKPSIAHGKHMASWKAPGNHPESTWIV